MDELNETSFRVKRKSSTESQWKENRLCLCEKRGFVVILYKTVSVAERMENVYNRRYKAADRL